MKRLISMSLATVLTVAAVSAGAQGVSEADAKKAIEARQAHFKELRDTNAPIGDMLRKKAPFDAALVAKNAAHIEHLATKIPGLYTADTRKFHAGIKTEALDGIWNSQADFKSKADDLQKAAGALVAAAKTGDEGATLKAAGAVGKACGSCHDSYRMKKQ